MTLRTFSLGRGLLKEHTLLSEHLRQTVWKTQSLWKTQTPGASGPIAWYPAQTRKHPSYPPGLQITQHRPNSGSAPPSTPSGILSLFILTTIVTRDERMKQVQIATSFISLEWNWGLIKPHIGAQQAHTIRMGMKCECQAPTHQMLVGARGEVEKYR